MDDRKPLRGAALRNAVSDPSGSIDHLYAGFDLEPHTGWLADLIEDRREPSSSELARIAALSGVPLTVLAGFRKPKESLAIALRSGAAATSDVRKEVERAHTLLQHLTLLASWYPTDDRVRQDSYRRVLRARSFDNYMRRAAQITAQQFRSFMGIDDDEPIDDLTEIVESLGVPVMIERLPRDVHGLTIHDSSGDAWRGLIMVNSYDWWTRQRYTLSHELAHVLYQDENAVIVDRKGEVDRDNLVELRAEYFARYLLAPDAAVRSFWLKHKSDPTEVALARLMMHFGISRDAAKKAVIEVCGVPDSTLAPLLNNAGTVATMMSSAHMLDQWESACASQHDRGASPMLLDLALNAYHEGFISPIIIADILNESDTGKVEKDLAEKGWGPGGLQTG